MELYQNPTLSIKDRVNDLISKMTLREKVAQVNQHLYGWKTYKKNNSNYEITDYLKKHVEWGSGLGALYGLFRADPWSRVTYSNGIHSFESYKVSNMIQKYVLDHSRLKIPTLIVEESPHGHQALDSVSFPTNLGKGATFDSELIHQMAKIQAQELRLKGVHLGLVTTLDLAKDPRWGRTEECFGEDPYLSANFTKNIISGFQGNLISNDKDFHDFPVPPASNHIGVVLKHFIAQGETQGGHNSGTVVLGKRDFREIYEPLAYATKNAMGVMAAYNDIDGVPCHVNQGLLTDLLRNRIGFSGLIMADGTALDRLPRLYSKTSEAIKAALEAGIDLSLWDDLYLNIESAISQFPTLLENLNNAVYHVLSIKFLLGLFDHPYLHVTEQELNEVQEKANRLNKQLAIESVTLVKNKNSLPLKKDNNSQIAVIGPNANSLYNLLGDYTAPQTKTMQEKTIFKEIQKTFPNVKYAKGCEIRDTKHSAKLIDEAVNLSNKSDIIVLVLGGSSTRNFDMRFLNNGAVSSKGINMDSGENVDVASLSLGGSQLELLKQLGKLKKKLITIMIQGRPYDIRQVSKYSDAVLIGWYPGQQGGYAISQILAGNYDPSGKLSITYPLNSEQLPVYYYQRDVEKNENYYDETGSPLYTFGFGQHFEEQAITYTNLKISNSSENSNNLNIQITLENRLNKSIFENVLLFCKLKSEGVLPRKKQLIAFKHISLNKYEKVDVNFLIPTDQLKFINIHGINQSPDSLTFLIQNLHKSFNLAKLI